MKFTCVTKTCPGYRQTIDLKAEQVAPLNFVQYKRAPFFYTVPPIYCGYCGMPPWEGQEMPEWFEEESE